MRQIVICLLLSWRDSLSKVSVWWSWLWNAVWPVKNVIYLLLSWRSCLDRIAMASEATVICRLLSWRDSLSKVSVWWSWLWNAVWSVKNKICLLLSWRVVKIELLWPVRQLWFACYCHGVILSASCLFDDHDCEMLYGQWRMSFACYYHDGIIWIELLWPVRQLWCAYYCHGVILSASCLLDDHDCEMLYGLWRMYFVCYCHDGIVSMRLLWSGRQLWFTELFG